MYVCMYVCMYIQLSVMAISFSGVYVYVCVCLCLCLCASVTYIISHYITCVMCNNLIFKKGPTISGINLALNYLTDCDPNGPGQEALGNLPKASHTFQNACVHSNSHISIKIPED